MEIFRQITANNVELKAYPFLKEPATEAYLTENEDILKPEELVEPADSVIATDTRWGIRNITRFAAHINAMDGRFLIVQAQSRAQHPSLNPRARGV